MQLLEKAARILEQPICDHCLGRQFSQLLSGYTDAERGTLLRTLVAMSIDKEDYNGHVDLANLPAPTFHNLVVAKKKPAKCSVCDGLFDKFSKFADKTAAAT